MSRVIVKGLPSGMKEERLQNLFKEVGTVTDCSLKYSKDGVFRKFAFIGFSTEDDAQKAIKRFNRSFIDTSRIAVEIAKDFGDATKPRAWSKYSRDSSAYQKMMAKLEEKQGKKKKEKEDKKQSNKVDELLGELKDDAEFQEFLEAHKNKSTKATWSNDTVAAGKSEGQTVAKAGRSGTTDKGDVIYDGDSDDSDEGMGGSEEEVQEAKAEESEEEVEEPEEPEDKLAKKAGVSDLDYLKSKMSSKSQHFSESSDSDSDESDSESGQESEKETTKKKKSKQKKAKKKKEKEPSPEPESEEEEDTSSEEEEDEEEKEMEEEKEKTDTTNTDVKYVIKMRGLPPTIRDRNIKHFFSPLVVERVKIPKNAKGNNTSCVATVEFRTEKDTDQAMRKNKNFIGAKRIFLYKVKKDVKETKAEKARPWEQKKEEKNDDDEEEETIAESGRLYVRNLSYTCKEDDLEAHFGTYGPLAEVHLPIDSITRKVKGFAFVTYMIPEHAVKAYADLDGTAFQGRMLHILPAKAKKEDDLQITDDMTFKKKREMKQKQQANSSHNWNTLFLGTSAVADVMAERYGSTKSQILDAESRQSLGVRMALGETQIVAETKQFLLDNGVCLDAFGQAAAARSKTVILVKNLPAGTRSEELRQLFSRHGIVGRIVLPPSGITAVVEFHEPTEARSAFRNLAYSKFQHLPLYLEWAPVDALKDADKPKPKPTVSEEEKQEERKEEPMEKGAKKEAKESSSSESEDEVEPESTIYVKNLNFETREDALKEHFSSCGDIRIVTIGMKKDMKNPGNLLSMGFGFVEFKQRASAQKALKTLQHSKLDDHQLELKVSNKSTAKPVSTKKKQDTKKKQTSTKILVRNIPFEAKAKEIRELFATFGELKTVRLPKKLGGTGSHRGFCFVDFLTKQDAKRAFKALCVSTRLYGRRLVLEWADADDSVEQLRKKTADHFHDEAPSKRLKKSGLMNELKLSAQD